MIQLKNFFLYSPGSESEGGNLNESKDDKKTDNPASSLEKEEGNEKKPLIEKIRDALQDWSNEDQHDQNFDDTRV